MTTWHKTTAGWLFALDRWGAKVCDISPDGLMVTLFDTAGKIIGSWDRRSAAYTPQDQPRKPRKLRDRDSLYWDQSPEPPPQRYTPPTPPVDESDRPIHMLVTGNGFSKALCEAARPLVRSGWRGTTDELAVTCPKCRAKLDEEAAEAARTADSSAQWPHRVTEHGMATLILVDTPAVLSVQVPGDPGGLPMTIPLPAGARITVKARR